MTIVAVSPASDDIAALQDLAARRAEGVRAQLGRLMRRGLSKARYFSDADAAIRARIIPKTERTL
jgi:hypothetical protein